MVTSMVSLILAFMIIIGGNPCYIRSPGAVPDPTAANPTDFERERNILIDHLDNITRIDETRNGETTQITTEIPFDTDFMKLNQYSRFDQWGLDYDRNGNLTQKSTQKMFYNYRNQDVRVTDVNTTTENKYDALGRRLQKIVTTGSQTKTENYYYAGHQVVEVRDGSYQVKRQFIYGNGIDEVVRIDVYNGSTITSYYLHTNEIGSTTAVTDADGNVVERYKYGLYGKPIFMDASGNVIPKSAIGNNILFQGREYEPETNFYYFRARHYDPIMGRFLQTDPMGYADSMNLYQGFNMNPVNFMDPMGTELSAETIKYWGSYEKALKYVKYNYGLYLEGGDSAATAYNKLVSNGLITDSGGAYDRTFALKMAMSPSLDVFDVTPAQFGKDVLGGVINAVTSMASMAAKGLTGSYNPYLWVQIDKAKNWVQSNINQAIGANEGSLGYFMGETYAPAIAGGWLSAEIELANATAQTGKMLPFLDQKVQTQVPLMGQSSSKSFVKEPVVGNLKSLPQPVQHKHHIFSKKFRDWFSRRGIDIDKYTIEIERKIHLSGTHGKGGFIGQESTKLIGRWNQRWSSFIKNNPNASAKEVYQFAGKLMDEFGFSNLPIVPY